MRAFPRRQLPLAAVLASLALVAGAQPFPPKYVLPVAPVLAHPATQRALDGMPVRFGAPAQQVRTPGPIGTEVRALSWARATDMRGFGARPANVTPDGRPAKLTEVQTCELALRYTLAELVEEARTRGAQSVVDIVSTVDDNEFNSPTMFECVPSHASSTVSLRGRIGGALPPVAVAPAAQMPTPVAAARAPAPEAVPVPAPMAVRPSPAPLPPVQPAPAASGFAAIDDIDAIPYISDAGRSRYRAWLGWDTPRAFAISESGQWASTAGLKPPVVGHPTDPVERALLVCNTSSPKPCKLYAVNRAVVWRR